MSDQYGITAHDLEPGLTVVVQDGVATFDTVDSWQMVIQIGTTVITDDAPTVVLSNGNNTATVTHAWVDGETDGTISQGKVKAKAIWPGGRPQSFPAKTWLQFSISSDA